MHHVSLTLIAAATSVIASIGAAASCDKEVAGFYKKGGLFDPAELTPQEHRAVWRAEDGTETPYNTSRWESANRIISDNSGMFLLSYDQVYFTGKGWEGPWQPMGQTSPFDAVEFGRDMNDIIRKNLTNVECHGTVDLDGVRAVKYSYRYNYHAPDDSTWWESDYVLYVAKKGGERLRTEEHNLIESWAPDPKTDVRVTYVTQLPGYTIPNPPDLP